jgi:hypothetical protein
MFSGKLREKSGANGQDEKRRGLNRREEEEAELSECDSDWARLIIHQEASSVYVCLAVAATVQYYNTNPSYPHPHPTHPS